VIHSTDDLIEQLTAMQDTSNQHAFRETLYSLVRLAKVEGRLEITREANDALHAYPAGSLH
jgi:hypothetical protein